MGSLDGFDCAIINHNLIFVELLQMKIILQFYNMRSGTKIIEYLISVDLVNLLNNLVVSIILKEY